MQRDLDWMDGHGPVKSVTQEKFNGHGEDRLAKVEAAQPMGRIPAKRSQTYTVLEKAQISPLQKQRRN
jgi:hypothetical protein